MCEKLSVYRAEKGKTQAEMAEAIGVPQPTYSRWETGKRHPRARHIKKISVVTNGQVTANDFFHEWS